MAANEGRLLLTEDKDFGDLVFRRGYAVPGVILMRTDIWNLQFQMQRLVAAIEQYGDQLFGHYVVVEDGRL
jgi:predicted nuclease of predicted toxin-antitoxin system